MSFRIPEAALGQHIAVLGKTGSGKTFAIKGIVEALLAAHKRVGIVDPTGAWWGLRSSHDGKSAGFPILVLGGDHGDLPLPALGGAAVARLLAQQDVNLVADTSQLTVGERTRWFIDFGRELYRLNRAPLHLVIDEAHTFAPQGKVPDPDTGKMLHAANTIASGGRSRGIRLTMITQRPQKLHKDTLTCADTLIAMRMLAPHDRLAVEDWIKGCGDMAQGKEILNSLASLQRGEGWVWYPEGGFLQRTKFPAIKTFDSSATPMDGGTVAAPKGMAEIDLTEIKVAMADAVKEAEANDPKLLRQEIARLKAEAGKKPAADTGPTPAWRAQYEGAHARDTAAAHAQGVQEGRAAAFRAVQPIAERLGTLAGAVGDTIEGFRTGLTRLTQQSPPPAPRRAPVAPAPVQRRTTPAPAAASASAYNGSMDKAARTFLTVLAQQQRPLRRNQIAVFAGYSAKSGHVDNTLGKLRSMGYINGQREAIEITPEGVSALGSYAPLPTGESLRQYWVNNLGAAASKFLAVLCDAYPKPMTRDEVALAAGYSVESGHVDNTLGALRTRDLITGRRGEIKASEDLFG